MTSDIYQYATLILLVALAFVALVAIFIIRKFRKQFVGKVKESPIDTYTGIRGSPINRSVATQEVAKAKGKMRTLDIEREIQSYAIRRLYEAQADGNLTQAERDKISTKYKEKLRSIKEEISRGKSIIALNELEKMQEELVDLFNRRFDDLNKRVEDLRLRSGIELLEPIKKPSIQEKTAPTTEKKPKAEKRKREVDKPKNIPEKSEADEKIERIMMEVEKVLDRLEQMEVEG